MKTMKNLFAAAIAVLIVNGAMASGNLKVNIASGSYELAEVEISNVKMSTFEIDVKDENGEVVFYKETKTPSTNYKRNYDFSNLEDGNYFLRVKIENESVETKFNIKRGELSVLEEKKEVDPVFVLENKELKLTYLNFSGENASLAVYDSRRNQLYDKELKSDFALHHGIDFSKVPKGKYEVVLSGGDKVHSYDVFID
jgi:hypothetical protein